MVAYIKSDLEFILEQIKISERHANGETLVDIFNDLGTPLDRSLGLRTVDGSFNNLLPGRELYGAANVPFPRLLDPVYRDAEGTPVDFDGPGGMPPVPTSPNYNPSDDPNAVVVDSSLRTISNLIVDQTLNNPAAIMAALDRVGVDPGDQLATAMEIKAAFDPIAGLFQAVDDATDTFADAQAAAQSNPGDQSLQDAADAAEAALQAAETELAGAQGTLDALLQQYGIERDGANLALTNIAPDEGLSASFNSWFTLFGQFFDHGLDLVNKGGSGTVFIPLAPDDPLYDPASPTNFMVLTRATVSPGEDGVFGTADDVEPVNTTTPFVDQNQTYTSHPSHQVFLREYEFSVDTDNDGVMDSNPVPTGNLIRGANGGMATWADVKAQARDMLGIELSDTDVGRVPLMRTDEYGSFFPSGPNGLPQLVFPGANPGDPNFFVTANLDTPVAASGAINTGHGFLVDIAHNAVPEGIADGDIEIGLGNNDPDSTPGYDNELLDAHFIAGDGRANENAGLTAVHHVFHAEHNRLVEHTKEVVLEAQDLTFLNEWLAVDVAALPATQQEIDDLVWDGGRLFQAAKFGTEMQYQHLVFEEFARKIQPSIDAFIVPQGFEVDIDASIVAEFAHVVYRFGHSMLTENIDRFDAQFNENHIGLIEGFLNPFQFDTNGTDASVDADVAAGSIIRGMTRQVGNEIDEFVTSALRNNLLGLPLDLATINLARGRDTGVPSLNAARRDFYEATNQNSILAPYLSWTDFASHLKNEASIINFIAAYGTHSLITDQTTTEGKRDAALTILTGSSFGGLDVPVDSVDFLNAMGAWAGGSLGGLENVDLWIGGLAEEIMPFGGMLGSTFSFVFETQLENLQNGDRFYYLQRLDGLHLFGEMENNSFASMMMRNTDATHLPSDVFSAPGLILEVDQRMQYNPGLGETPGADGILEDDPDTPEDESADNLGNDPTGTSLFGTPLVVRDNPVTIGEDTNYLQYTGEDHVVLGGTNPGNLFNPSGDDILIASIGDDTLHGDGGNDRIEGGFGNDIINGGDGDDIITDAGGDDNIKAGAGNDFVNAGPGLDLVLAGPGNDFVVLGTDAGSEVFAGTGNDYIMGSTGTERILGNEGDDWIERGTFDGAPGDNFDEINALDKVVGHDVFIGAATVDEFIGEGGDDIMVGSAGVNKNVGMSGFDWVTYKDSPAVDVDLRLAPPAAGAIANGDTFEEVEGLSGSHFADTLHGSDIDATTIGAQGAQGSQLTNAGVLRIAGLAELLGLDPVALAADPDGIAFDSGDILLGGDGGDVIEGHGGDDIIDGNRWLDVSIGVFENVGEDGGVGALLATHSSMSTLVVDIASGAINPGQFRIVREIKTSDSANDTDTAVYSGNFADYDVFDVSTGNQLDQNDLEGNTFAQLRIVDTLGVDSTANGDLVSNIERLQFADGTIQLVANNAPMLVSATNTVNISEDMASGLIPIGASDADDDALTYTIKSGTEPVSGQVVFQAGGFIYTPNPDANGADSFTIVIDDGFGGTVEQVVTVSIAPVNDDPTVPPTNSVSIQEDMASPPVVIGAVDVDGDTLAYTIAPGNEPALGAVTFSGDTFTYTPNADVSGSDSFTIVVSDGFGNPTQQVVSVDIAAVNDAPVVTGPVSLGSIPEDSGPRQITQGELLANSSDTDGPTLAAVSLAIAAGAGMLVDNGDGTWTFTPETNDDTSVSFSYQVSDGIEMVATTADLDITPIDENPMTPDPIFTGTPGPDSFVAGPGVASYLAGAGIDTITFGFALTEASVSYAGNTIVIDGPASHTVLSGFETYVFADGTVSNNDGNWLVDDLFYYSSYHDVWNAAVDADLHYDVFGWQEGRDPSAFFDTGTYLAIYQDVNAAGVNPLDHFHQSGWMNGNIPSLNFDPQAYRADNPDVAAANVDPLEHFLAYGAGEGRQPSAPTEYLADNGFDYVYYLNNNPDVAVAGVDPFEHFQLMGWQEGRNPNALFDTVGYLATYTDVAAAGLNPLDHYDVYGWQEGRDPSTGFDTNDYLAAYPDVAAANINPLNHFLVAGIHEGRSPFADGMWG